VRYGAIKSRNFGQDGRIDGFACYLKNSILFLISSEKFCAETALSRLYPGFIQALSRLYPGFIQATNRIIFLAGNATASVPAEANVAAADDSCTTSAAKGSA
jgi:hypothetical protein